MEMRQLGRTGTRVSEACLGAMTFGRETPEEESAQILDRYLDAGGNFVDTANAYSRGSVGGDPRTAAGRRSARPDRPRDQVPHDDGLGSEPEGRRRGG